MSMNPMATHGAFSWVEHHGPDAGAARSFYEKILGWTMVDQPMQGGGIYPCIVVGEQPIGGFAPPPAEKGSWLAYITVDDVDSRTKAAAESGAKVLTEPTTHPDVGRFAILEDPFGAVVALITYKEEST